MKRLLVFLAALMFFALFIILIGGAVYWYADTREQTTKEWWEEARPVLQAYYDTLETADVTSRGSLTPVILLLQEQRREWLAIEASDESQSTKDAFDTAMQESIALFQDFVRNEENDTLDPEPMNAAWRAAWDSLHTLGFELDE